MKKSRKKNNKKTKTKTGEVNTIERMSFVLRCHIGVPCTWTTVKHKVLTNLSVIG